MFFLFKKQKISGKEFGFTKFEIPAIRHPQFSISTSPFPYSMIKNDSGFILDLYEMAWCMLRTKGITE